MKTKTKKGFTLVELVIVIAVIAILAAVLIPTFSSLVNKANLSADEQAVRQMNTALAIYTAENGKPENGAEVKTGLSENNINTDTMTPVTKGYAFYWDNENNKIVLVGVGKATAKNTWSLLTSNGYGTEHSVSSETDLTKAISESTTEMPALVTLTSDLTLENEVEISDNKSMVLDLNGKNVTCQSSETTNLKCLRVKDGGSLVVENGSLSGNRRIFENKSGTLTLKNLTINISVSENESEYTPIRIDGISDTSIVGCNINTSGLWVVGTNSYYDTSDGARIYISDSKLVSENGVALFVSIYSNVIIENSTFEGKLNGGWFRGCNATIRNSEFKYDNTSSDTVWKTGIEGKRGSIIFASGGTGYNGYFKSANYVCENVTAEDVFVHQPTGGEVKVSGIDVKQWYFNKYGEMPN